MVAYSFNRIFVEQVERLTKLQTVRGERKRHARPGEPVQLYTGLRTKGVRKLVENDPICTGVTPIRIEVPEPAADQMKPLVPAEGVRIELGGRLLDFSECHAFAVADGFGAVGVRCEDKRFRSSCDDGDEFASPLSLFGAWWWQDHGAGWWQGVVVTWRPAT